MISSQLIYRLGLPILMGLAFVAQINPTEVDKPDNSTVSNATNNTNKTNGQDGGGPWLPTTLVTVSMVVAIIGVICNSALILVIIIDPLGILQKGPWVTIINLAFADTMTCLAMSFINNPNAPPSKLYWFIANAFNCFGTTASFFLLTLLTVEIYVVTRFPLKSKCIMTKRKIAVAVTCVYLLAMALTLPSILAYLGKTSMHTSLVLYISWMGVLEFSVLVQLFVKMLIIQEILKSGRGAINNNKNMVKHKNIAKTVMMLNFILLITNIPSFIAYQLRHLAVLGKMSDDPLFEKFPHYYMPIALMNFVANPLIYAWRLPDYRRTLQAILRGDNRKTSLRLTSITLRSST